MSGSLNVLDKQKYCIRIKFNWMTFFHTNPERDLIPSGYLPRIKSGGEEEILQESQQP